MVWQAGSVSVGSASSRRPETAPRNLRLVTPYVSFGCNVHFGALELHSQFNEFSDVDRNSGVLNVHSAMYVVI